MFLIIPAAKISLYAAGKVDQFIKQMVTNVTQKFIIYV